MISYPRDWQCKPVEEIATLTSGGTPSRYRPEYWNGAVPWITTSCINFNHITQADEYITELGLQNSSAKLFPANTILMAMYGQGVTRGRVAILDIEAATNQACAAITVYPPHCSKYVYYYLQNQYHHIRELGHGGNQKNLNQSLIGHIPVLLPPLPEQRKIAEILSTWDAAISTLEQLIIALELRKRGLMQKLLTGLIRTSEFESAEWETFSIGELFEEMVAGDWGEEADGSDQCYPVIRAANFSKDCKLDLTPQRLVTRKLSPKTVNTHLLEDGNLLLEKSGGSPEQPVGRIVYFNGESKRFGYSNFLQKLEVKSRFDPRLIYYFLYWNYLSGKVLRFQQKTTGIINFQLKDYLRFEKISLPSDAREQEYIVSVFRACDEQISLYKRQLSARKNQRDGLAQRLLTGQVRVRVDDEQE